MRLYSGVFLVLTLGVALLAAPVAKAQQQQQGHNGPSKYLYLTNISLKPGTMGQYRKLEQENISALRAAKAPGHQLTMSQITGHNLVISLYGFDSFADLQKTHDQIESNSQLVSKLRSDDAAEGAAIRNEQTSIYRFRKDLSLHADQSLKGMRFMEMWVVKVKPGHSADFENIAKAEAKAQASDANVHWAMFEKMFGQGSDGVYLFVVPMKSLANVDTRIANRHKMMAMVGKGLTGVVRATMSKAVSSSEEDLFVIDPKISYVPESWVQSSPNFWGKK